MGKLQNHPGVFSNCVQYTFSGEFDSNNNKVFLNPKSNH